MPLVHEVRTRSEQRDTGDGVLKDEQKFVSKKNISQEHDPRKAPVWPHLARVSE